MADAETMSERAKMIGYESVAMAMEWLQAQVYETAVSKGWYEKPSDDGTRIALMHSELSEALEELRKPVQAASSKCPEVLAVEEELADVIIRIADFAEARGFNLGKAIVAKARYNEGRPHRHGGKVF